MPFEFTYEGTLEGANEYFALRLHQEWTGKPELDQEKALQAATNAINALVYAGVKASVYTLLANNPDATDEEIAAAEAEQEFEFPRDDQETVPTDVEIAIYEEAHELIRGRDPEQEFANLALSSGGVGSTRDSIDTLASPQHICNGILSFIAWRYLKPYIADNNNFRVVRVS